MTRALLSSASCGCFRRGIAAVFACAVVIACNESSTPGGDDSAASTEPPAGAPDRRTPWSLMEEVRIGGTNVGPYTLGRVRAIAVDRLERVYVADMFSKTVKVFDRLGFLVRELGREGQGPGEFRDPVGLAWLSDATLLVVDYRNARYSMYDTAGLHIEDKVRPPLGSLWPWPGVIQKDHIVEPVVQTGAYQLALVDSEETSAPVRYFPYPLATIPPEEWRPAIYSRTETSVRRVPVPFGARYVWSLDGMGGVWVGSSAEYKLVHRTLDGRVLGEARRSITPPPVTPTERARAVQGLGPGVPSQELRRIPDRKPFFRALVPDSARLLVIREGDGGDWLMDVFEDYRFVGSTPLPDRPDVDVRPIVRDHAMWMVALDSLDVPMVVRYRMVPSPR